MKHYNSMPFCSVQHHDREHSECHAGLREPTEHSSKDYPGIHVCMYVQCGLPGARTDVGSALLPALGVTHTAYMARAHVHTSVKRTTCTFQSECRIQFYVYTHVC